MNAATDGGAPTQVHKLDFVGSTEHLASARDAVTRVLRRTGAQDDLLGIAQLVVSELVTNGIEAAPGEPLTVTVEQRAGDVVLSVRSRGRPTDVDARPGKAEDRTGKPLPRGRGLDIVRTVSSSLSINAATDDQGRPCVEVVAVLTDRPDPGQP